MTIQEMKERKRELGLSNGEISRRTGIPVGTLQKLFSGKTSSPRQKTVEALEKVLSSGSFRYDLNPSAASVLRESAALYGLKDENEPATREKPAADGGYTKDGGYTIEDYYALPDEQRVELIDGVFYDMASPTAMHQMILGDLYLLFRACVDAHDVRCEVFLSPCDVQLDMDNRTMVQPDLFVLCQKLDLSRRAIPGAPDLVVEILSPSTRSRDMLLKLNKYHHAGVREYWIIDPDNRMVYVYDFTKDFSYKVYPFDSQIPIALSDGTCSIDFSAISRHIARYNN